MFFRKKREVDEQEEIEVKKEVRTRKKEEPEDQWDKRRIITTLFFGVVALLIIFELKNRFFPEANVLGESTIKKASEIEKPQVKGPRMDVETKVGSSINDIKDSINSINPEVVASSSPQIQKVLKDIQGIKNLPADQARNTCLKICSGI